ncbi:hypothetical protein ACR1PO_15645 [Chryseobacterium sp. RRHN12]|uniref:hypothetical protein n=1 Tax=Chryseobacterium sp. RRHN12 TaxID=3437884 RepID=UPI003D9B3027
MKQLEIKTNKRLLIVEYETEAESAIEWALMHAFKNPNIVNHGHKVKPICNGSDLTNEIAKGFIPIDEKGARTKYPKAFLISYKRFLNAFIDVIESKGWYWGENPVSLEREKIYRNMGDIFKADGIFKVWQESESRTFKPDQCLIFEIL